MIRTTVFALLAFGFAATAVAKVFPVDPLLQAKSATVVAQTAQHVAMAEARPQRLILEKCAVEDCSDTPQ